MRAKFPPSRNYEKLPTFIRRRIEIFVTVTIEQCEECSATVIKKLINAYGTKIIATNSRTNCFSSIFVSFFFFFFIKIKVENHKKGNLERFSKDLKN